MKYVTIWSYDLASQICFLINDVLSETYMYSIIDKINESDTDID